MAHVLPWSNLITALWYYHRWKFSAIKNPENVYFADFGYTFVYKIYPEHEFKNPEFRENPENFHLCTTYLKLPCFQPLSNDYTIYVLNE